METIRIVAMNAPKLGTHGLIIPFLHNLKENPIIVFSKPVFETNTHINYTMDHVRKAGANTSDRYSNLPHVDTQDFSNVILSRVAT